MLNRTQFNSVPSTPFPFKNGQVNFTLPFIESNNPNVLSLNCNTSVFAQQRQIFGLNFSNVHPKLERTPHYSLDTPNNNPQNFLVSLPVIRGTSIKFNAVVRNDSMQRGGAVQFNRKRYQCLTMMKEYYSKSFEELRKEDYEDGMKGNQNALFGQGLVNNQVCQNFGHSLSEFHRSSDSNPLNSNFYNNHCFLNLSEKSNYVHTFNTNFPNNVNNCCSVTTTDSMRTSANSTNVLNNNFTLCNNNSTNFAKERNSTNAHSTNSVSSLNAFAHRNNIISLKNNTNNYCLSPSTPLDTFKIRNGDNLNSNPFQNNHKTSPVNFQSVSFTQQKHFQQNFNTQTLLSNISNLHDEKRADHTNFPVIPQNIDNEGNIVFSETMGVSNPVMTQYITSNNKNIDTECYKPINEPLDNKNVTNIKHNNFSLTTISDSDKSSKICTQTPHQNPVSMSQSKLHEMIGQFIVSGVKKVSNDILPVVKSKNIVENYSNEKSTIQPSSLKDTFNKNSSKAYYLNKEINDTFGELDELETMGQLYQGLKTSSRKLDTMKIKDLIYTYPRSLLDSMEFQKNWKQDSTNKNKSDIESIDISNFDVSSSTQSVKNIKYTRNDLLTDKISSNKSSDQKAESTKKNILSQTSLNLTDGCGDCWAPLMSSSPISKNNCGVKSTRTDYYTIPPVDNLDDYITDNGKCLVSGLTIGRKGVGKVYFPDTIDVSNLNIDELVIFENKSVTVYPKQDMKPSVGIGLNRRARITLHAVFPRDKVSLKYIRNPKGEVLDLFVKMLKNNCKKNGSTYLNYVPSTGSWLFSVEHF